MEWIFGIGLFLIIIIAMSVFLLLRGRNPIYAPARTDRHPAQDEAPRSASPTHIFVPQDHYRFGGKAIPQFQIVYAGDHGARTGRTIYVKG